MKARKKLDGHIYAIKKITQKSSASLTEVLKEVRLLSQLSHPYVVRYYNTWTEEVLDTSETDDDLTATDVATTEDSISDLYVFVEAIVLIEQFLLNSCVLFPELFKLSDSPYPFI